MPSRTVPLIVALVYSWCALPARAAVPYDDSSAAPAGYEAICAMPKYPVFDVRTYGAKGDGKTDDTMAIRSAIAAAVEGGQGGIIFFPAGTYAVCPQPDDQPNGFFRPIFNLGGRQNLVFLGTGAGRSILKGYCVGLADPAKNWKVTGDGYVKISRFGLFQLAGSSRPTTGIQFRSLVIDGNLPYTGNSTVGGIRETGDGWDMSHKAITCNGPGTVDQILIFNCAIKNWRGEEVYAGGSTIGRMNVINGSIRGCNASAMSCSATSISSAWRLAARPPETMSTTALRISRSRRTADDARQLHGAVQQQAKDGSRQRHRVAGKSPLERAPRNIRHGQRLHDRQQSFRDSVFGNGPRRHDQRQHVHQQRQRHDQLGAVPVSRQPDRVLELHHHGKHVQFDGHGLHQPGADDRRTGDQQQHAQRLGSRLIGGKFPNRQTGFVVSNNTLSEGTTDVQNPLPAGVQTIPLWSGTSRPDGIGDGGVTKSTTSPTPVRRRSFPGPTGPGSTTT